jgi:hypothetical protein
MEQLRSDLKRDVENTAETLRTTLDWRHHVAVHPWLCLTTAVVAGFVMVPRRIVPARHPDCGSQGPIERDHATMVFPPTGAGGIVTTITSVAASMAVREAISWLARFVEGRVLKGNDGLAGRHENEKTSH